MVRLVVPSSYRLLTCTLQQNVLGLHVRFYLLSTRQGLSSPIQLVAPLLQLTNTLSDFFNVSMPFHRSICIL